MASKPSRVASLVSATLSNEGLAAGSPHDPPPRMTRAPTIVKPTPVAPATPQADGEAGPAPSVAAVLPPAPVAQEAAPPAAAALPPAPVAQEVAPAPAADAPPPSAASAPSANDASGAPVVAPPPAPANGASDPAAGGGKGAGEDSVRGAQRPANVAKPRGRPNGASQSDNGPDDQVPMQVYVPRIARDKLNIIRIERHYPSTAALLTERIDDFLEEEGHGRLCGTTRARKG